MLPLLIWTINGMHCHLSLPEAAIRLDSWIRMHHRNLKREMGVWTTLALHSGSNTENKWDVTREKTQALWFLCHSASGNHKAGSLRLPRNNYDEGSSSLLYKLRIYQRVKIICNRKKQGNATAICLRNAQDGFKQSDCFTISHKETLFSTCTIHYWCYFSGNTTVFLP